MANSSRSGILSALLAVGTSVVSALRRRGRTDGVAPRPRLISQPHARGTAVAEGRHGPGGIATIEVDPADHAALRITYEPQRDGEPDAGEIVWTWVPYEENDGRGKDRPVLVIARHTADRVFAVKLTSTSRDGDRDYVSIGRGPWDSQGRESWADLDQLYSVHVEGMRREAAILDRARYAKVAAELARRHGWAWS